MGSARAFLWLLCIPALAMGQAGEPGRQQDRARELVTSGKPLEAIPIYEELLRASPGNATLRINLAVAHFKAGQYDATIEACREALKASPQPPAAWLFIGASYLQLQRFADAVEPLERAIAALPGERNGRLMLGEALLASGRPGDAVEHLGAASRLLPDNPRAWYGLERGYSALSAKADAEMDLRGRDSAYWYGLAGDAAMRRQRHGLALSHYREALRLMPGLAGVHASIAALYRAVGKSEWSAEETRRESGIASDAHTPAGAFRSGNHAECIRLAASNSVEDLYWKSKAYRALSASAWSKLEGLPPSSQLHELRARDLDENGRSREAAVEWREALKLAPANPILERGLAASLMKALDYTAALPLLEKLLQAQPASAELQLLCGRAWLAREQPGTALPYLQRAVDLDPGSLAAQAALGEALLRAGKHEEAIPALKASLGQDPDGVRHFQLARAYRESGRRELERETMAEYKRLIAEAEGQRRELEREYPITPP